MSDKPLEQFVSSAKLLTDHKSAADLIVKAIDSPNVFSFNDLLEIELIASMSSHSDYKKFHDLLKLFSYGTYLDYKANEKNLPSLSESAKTKLRHLSIITLSSKCRTIRYETLSANLEVTNIRELEDLIIEAFYADIIKGKLDQEKAQLEIDFTIGRDVTDEQVDVILSVLSDWCKNCDIALNTIQNQITQANVQKQTKLDSQANIEAEVANLKKSIKLQSMEVESMNTSAQSKKSAKSKGTKSLLGTKITK